MLPEDGWIVPAYHTEDDVPNVAPMPPRVTWVDRLKAILRFLKIEVEFDD